MYKRECGIIDFLRLIFAIVVVLLHSYYLTDEGFQRFVPHGYLAVEFFFIVSGYLMANKAFKLCKQVNIEPAKETERYIFRKYTGLLPYLIFGWFISYFAIHTNTTITVGKKIEDALSSIFQFLCIDMAGIDGFQMMGATWYISAILLCMPLLYYLLIKKWDFTQRIIVPLLMLLFYGILYQKYGAPLGVHDWNGFVYMGILRAFAGLCLGSICFRISFRLQNKSFTKLGKVVLTIIEISGYLVTAVSICSPLVTTTFSFSLLPFLAISISISFSQCSYTRNWFRIKIGKKFLGSYMRDLSVGIYFSHARWQGFVIRTFKDRITFQERFVPYIILSLVSGCICVLFVELWKYLLQRWGKRIAALFFK